jgi:hypothetical protein
VAKSRKNAASSSGLKLLTSILLQAVEAGAECVEMERVSEGLEIILLSGNSGAGYVIDGTRGQEVIDSVYELKKPGRGRFRIRLPVEEYLVRVGTYETFGETAYQLKIAKPKR